MTIYDRILQNVETGHFSTVTFDVFDTLVFRHVNCPAALFEKVVHEVPLLNGVDGNDYRILREQAERVARNRETALEDIPFEAIFQCMPFDEITQHALQQAELEAEKKQCLINLKLVSLIEKLMARGIEVALISDMYLSSTQIRNTFFTDSPLLASLPLYVSSQYGVAKYSGNLFSRLAEEQGWTFSHWLHIGDNIKADVSAPQALGITACHFHPTVDSSSIIALENRQFLGEDHSSATRLLASLEQQGEVKEEKIAFELGAFVWGPALNAFADWVIKQSDMTGCKHILCLMREGYVFTPIIQKRLAMVGRDDLKVSSFYVSRKSAFWPGIDTTKSHWLEDVMDALMAYRGYTLRNFVRDFHTSPTLLDTLNGDLELKNIEGLFVDGQPLYQRLCQEAKDSRHTLEETIITQRQLLKRYFKQVATVDYGKCAVVDFGNGGTIQHNLETIFDKKAGANLLFYSSLRAYRFVDQTLYRAFISPGTEKFRLSELLARSPECIEGLLLGSQGSTLGYEENTGQVTPCLAQGMAANSGICEAFLSGCLTYMDTAKQFNQPCVSHTTAQAIVARYLLLPTDKEAGLFKVLLHQDNFGTDGEYPVIDEQQIQKVKEHGLAETWVGMNSSNGWEIGQIHWPSAVIALIDNTFIPQVLGLMQNSNRHHVIKIVDQLSALGWTSVSVYGAGEFFREILPFLQSKGITISHVVDRRAESDESITAAGYSVITLQQAFDRGASRFLIASFAFKKEIAERIGGAAKANGLDDIHMISA